LEQKYFIKNLLPSTKAKCLNNLSKYRKCQALREEEAEKDMKARKWPDDIQRSGNQHNDTIHY